MQLTLDTPPGFDFYETLHAHGWRHLPPFEWDEEARTLRRVERLESGGAALLSLRADSSDSAVSVACDGEGKGASEAELAAKARRMLQLDIEIVQFHAYCAECPERAHATGRGQGRMLRSPTLFEDVVKIVCKVRSGVAAWNAACRGSAAN